MLQVNINKKLHGFMVISHKADQHQYSNRTVMVSSLLIGNPIIEQAADYYFQAADYY